MKSCDFAWVTSHCYYKQNAELEYKLVKGITETKNQVFGELEILVTRHGTFTLTADRRTSI